MRLFVFPEQENLGQIMINKSNFVLGNWIIRHFPDQETYVRILDDVRDQDVYILCSLNNPDNKTNALIFLSRTLKTLGARTVTLIAPYLGYMRQDKVFHPGEALSSQIYASLLANYIDHLITVDPHLHRYKNLDELYPISSKTLHATDLVVDYIQKHYDQEVVIIGPDSESMQWSQVVAEKLGVPFCVLEKKRFGDKNVQIKGLPLDFIQKKLPILVDDIVSTGCTLIEASNLIVAPCVCIIIHGVFANESYKNLIQANITEVVTTNSITHSSNGIDLSDLLLEALKD